MIEILFWMFVSVTILFSKLDVVYKNKKNQNKIYFLKWQSCWPKVLQCIYIYLNLSSPLYYKYQDKFRN